MTNPIDAFPQHRIAKTIFRWTGDRFELAAPPDWYVRAINEGTSSDWADWEAFGCTPITSYGEPDSLHIEVSDTPDGHERDRKTAAIDQKHVRLQKRERAERRRWYDGYLNSPAWRAKRRAVMERAKGLCEGCRSRPAVHVHHLTYDHVGDELLWELVAVCDHCHARCHPDKQECAA